MSQAPNPFTQAASQGYGDFAPTLDDENSEIDDEQQQQQQQDDDDDELETSQSPKFDGQEINEFGFTQTQERSYPTGIDEDDNDEHNYESDDQVEISENEQEDEDEDARSSSSSVDDSNEQQEVEEDNVDKSRKQSQSHQQHRRVQIMNDSDNEEEQPLESTSVVRKEKNRNFLKQFIKKRDDAHRKRQNNEYKHQHKSKRFRKTSHDDDKNSNVYEREENDNDNIEATSDIDDVVDDIFGKDINDNEEEADDQEEIVAELSELNDNEEVQQEDEEQIFEADDDDNELSIPKANYSSSKTDILYDIDLYLEQKAEKRRGNRRRDGKDGTVDLAGPDSDRLVTKLIDQMRIATEEDRIFNKSRQPATAKLLLLPTIDEHLCRADLTEIFLDNGILTVFKDWLSPLPDKSLPNIKIRESLIKILQQFGIINSDLLRDSGIGKVLMYLYKHPRETKENKIKLIKIIHEWARPIFNLDTDYKLLTREERQQRDVDQASLKRQTSLTGKQKSRRTDVDLPFIANRRHGDDDDEFKDDDCPRARVPRPSNKDYVLRPVSTVEFSEKKDDSKKKSISRLDEIKRRQQDRKRLSKPMSIVKLSIEGNKMHL